MKELQFINLRTISQFSLFFKENDKYFNYCEIMVFVKKLKNLY